MPNAPSTHRSSRASTTTSFYSASKPTSTHVVTITPSTTRKPPNYAPTHHINTPPTSFKNPWPSFPAPHSLLSVLQARFFNTSERNFVPVPTDRSKLVPVVAPDWGKSRPDGPSKLKATWIGHASFLVEFPSSGPGQRGIRVLLDPVFSERMSPFTWLGPKRFTPAPCAIDELPEVDLICISHNHYDHLDAATVKFVCQRARGSIKVLCALGVGENLRGMGLTDEEIVEMDWWDGVNVRVVEDGVVVGDVRVVCTPSQHMSGRWVNDHGHTLWCSFVLEEVLTGQRTAYDGTGEDDGTRVGKKLFFGGDTAYRAIFKGATEQDIAKLPVCTAFSEVGEMYGPFDLSLLPIGCYSPRWWMSAVHCAPEDSIEIHRDIRSRKSIGMHYGVLRGGISQYYEDVTEPPKRWKEAGEKAGLKWQDEFGLCGVGETVSV